MTTELQEKLRAAQDELEPQFKALRGATSALKRAMRLASEDKLDALAMQKALVKLEQANELVDSAGMQAATSNFAHQTQEALDALAFAFARDLKETFEERGQTVEGRPPTLVVDDLILNIDINARKAQWLYGKEPLTKLIPLSINGILRAYDRQRKAILDREIDVDEFLHELYAAWQNVMDKRSQRPTGGRLNLLEVYSQLVLNRQATRFWNAPSRSTFRDYDRALFVRDLVLARQSPTVTVDGKTYHWQLGTATKSQAESASRSIWIPRSALDGEYVASIAFEER